MNDIQFDSLNAYQIKAVSHTSGPSIILAGAGSGKTRVLVYKVFYLITQEKVDPKNIIMITLIWQVKAIWASLEHSTHSVHLL